MYHSPGAYFCLIVSHTLIAYTNEGANPLHLTCMHESGECHSHWNQIPCLSKTSPFSREVGCNGLSTIYVFVLFLLLPFRFLAGLVLC